MTVTDELDKLIREKVEPAARALRQDLEDLYIDVEKNTVMSPIEESTDAELARLRHLSDEDARRPENEKRLSFRGSLRMAERIALLERRRAEGMRR